MTKFMLGFVVATTVWIAVLSTVNIPEYTVMHRCLTV